MTHAITIAMADRAVAVDGDPMLLAHVESRYLTVPVTKARPDASIELVLGAGRRPDPGSRCSWIEIEDSALTVDDQMARLWVQPDDYRYILSFLVPLAIAHLAAPRGWVALHAAAVAGERTVLLIGPTGVGKSTLSLLATPTRL